MVHFPYFPQHFPSSLTVTGKLYILLHFHIYELLRSHLTCYNLQIFKIKLEKFNRIKVYCNLPQKMQQQGQCNQGLGLGLGLPLYETTPRVNESSLSIFIIQKNFMLNDQRQKLSSIDVTIHFIFVVPNIYIYIYIVQKLSLSSHEASADQNSHFTF